MSLRDSRFTAAFKIFGGWIISATGAAHTEPRELAHERRTGTPLQYGVSVGEWDPVSVAPNSLDEPVSGGLPALLKKIKMDTGSTGTVTIKNGTTVLKQYTPGSEGEIDFDGMILSTSLVITTDASAGCLIEYRVK